MSGETEQQVSGWTVDTLKAYIEERLKSQAALHTQEIVLMKEAVKIARDEMDRRLGELNQLRKEVTEDRSEFVKIDVYAPAHEDLRRQRTQDNEKSIVLAGTVQNAITDLASMKSSQMWLTRLVFGALILGIIAYVFQRLTGR